MQHKKSYRTHSIKPEHNIATAFRLKSNIKKQALQNRTCKSLPVINPLPNVSDMFCELAAPAVGDRMSGEPALSIHVWP